MTTHTRTKTRRIQRKRTRGYRMPPGAKYIGRGSKWGNPYTVADYGRGGAIEKYAEYLNRLKEYAPGVYNTMLEELRGHDLACWCKEADACHGDILLAHVSALP